MEKIITGNIVYRIKVLGLRYIVLRRHIQWEMLGTTFLVSMQHWITYRQTIKHISLRWTISFVIKLFIF